MKAKKNGIENQNEKCKATEPHKKKIGNPPSQKKKRFAVLSLEQLEQNQFWSIDYQEKRSIDNLMAFLDESITLLITRIPQPLLCVDLIHCELIGFRLTSDDTVGRLVDVGRTASN